MKTHLNELLSSMQRWQLKRKKTFSRVKPVIALRISPETLEKAKATGKGYTGFLCILSRFFFCLLLFVLLCFFEYSYLCLLIFLPAMLIMKLLIRGSFWPRHHADTGGTGTTWRFHDGSGPTVPYFVIMNATVQNTWTVTPHWWPLTLKYRSRPWMRRRPGM